MKYKIERFPNPDMIQIHLSQRITNKRYDTYLGGILSSITTLSEDLKDLLKLLMDIPGVINVSIEEHGIGIEKGKCFEWEEMLPELIKAIDIMLATNETLEALPEIIPTQEELIRIQQEKNRTLLQYFFNGLNTNGFL